jgi:hypothetical protein
MSIAYTSKTFAEAFPGAIVSFKTTGRDGNPRSEEGRVVGWIETSVLWRTDTLLVEPTNDANLFTYPWDFNEMRANNGYHLCVKDFDQICYIAPSDILLIIRKTGAKKEEKWPHTCTACQQPAQFIFTTIDCSNFRCKHYQPK